MAKPELGRKRVCQSCGAPFYDLKKKNIECPKCGVTFNPAPPAKPKRLTPGKPVVKAADEKPVKDITLDEGGDDGTVAAKKEAGGEEDEKDKDDELIEDASDLGEDDDDMSEVKEHIDDGVEDKN